MFISSGATPEALIKVKMIIKCDDRDSGEVIEGLRKLKMECEVCRLNVGDYVWQDVCIERKTIDDFCSSIIDGRIKEQSDNMLKEYEHCFVLISGRIGDRTIDINENCLLGMISSLVCRGIQVVCVDNDKQLTFLMKRIFERFNDGE